MHFDTVGGNKEYFIYLAIAQNLNIVKDVVGLNKMALSFDYWRAGLKVNGENERVGV